MHYNVIQRVRVCATVCVCVCVCVCMGVCVSLVCECVCVSMRGESHASYIHPTSNYIYIYEVHTISFQTFFSYGHFY